MFYILNVAFGEKNPSFYNLSVPKFTANLYCICLSILQIYADADLRYILGHSV